MTRTLLRVTLLASAALLAACQTPGQPGPTAGTGASAPAAQAGAPAQPASRPAQATATAPSTPVDFRLAQDQGAPGLAALPLGQRTLWVMPQPVLDRSDLAGIAPIQDAEGRAYVRFDFTPAGTQRLAAVTRANRGASLVITVGDTVVAAPRLGEPITQGVLNLPVADARSAQAIVQAVVGQSAQAASPQR